MMYRMTDKVIHELEDYEEIVKFRLESLNGEKDKWGIEIYYNGQLAHHSRYNTEAEANYILESFVNE